MGLPRAPQRIVAFATLSILGACYPKAGAVPAPVAPADVDAAQRRWPDASQGSLASGRDAFVSRCNTCHAYPDVKSVGEDEWPKVLEKMGKKAALDPKTEQDVLRFVLVARARP